MHTSQIGSAGQETFRFLTVFERIARQRRPLLVVGHQAGSSNGRTVTVVTAL